MKTGSVHQMMFGSPRDTFTPTYMNCAWSEARILAGAPVWLDCWRSRWCCLALSDRVGTVVDVQPNRCETCPLWKLRADVDQHDG